MTPNAICKKLPTSKGIFCFMLFIAFFSFSAVAQEQVTGKIIDADGEPIQGATVYIKGSTTGTVTDIDGNYELAASSTDTMVFSFIGMISEEKIVGSQTTIDIILIPDISELDEIVVIGYGTQKKEDLTGAIAVVDVDEISNMPGEGVAKALQGRASGVLVSQNSGTPGSDVNIKIRGIGSIEADVNPLYVVDGIMTGSAILSSINPNDIESIQVLKDASASAIYGARGANGVIIIKTKRGSNDGKPRISYNTYVGATTLNRKLDLLNPEEYLTFMDTVWATSARRDSIFYERYPTTAFSRDSINKRGGLNGTNWEDALTQVGTMQSHSLSVAGGNEFSNYFFSGDYYKEDGLLRGTGMERYAVSANSNFNFGKFKFGETIRLVSRTRSFDSELQGEPWTMIYQASPLMPTYEPANLGGFAGPTDSITGSNERTNPLAEQMLNEYEDHTVMGILGLNLEYEIFKGLSVKLMPSIDYSKVQYDKWTPKYELGNIGSRSNPINRLYRRNTSYIMQSIESQMTYDRSIGDHNFNLIGVFSQQKINIEYDEMIETDFTNPNLIFFSFGEGESTIGGNVIKRQMRSYLGRVNYNYKGKYLLTASLRRDGSSRAAPEESTGVFPSFSLGWKVSEDFLQNIDEISLLKVRLGWGKTGNENIPDYLYYSLLTDPDEFTSGVWGRSQWQEEGRNILKRYGNGSITWETANMTNIGIDLNMFSNRLQFMAEYFHKLQDGMLVRTPLSDIHGVWQEDANPFGNNGVSINRGFEFNLTYQKQEGRFNYRINGNISTVKNKITKLPGARIFNTGNTILGRSLTTAVSDVDHTIASLYGYVAEGILQNDDFLQDDDGNLVVDEDGNYTLLHAFQSAGTSPGDIRFKDLNGDNKIDLNDRTIIGKSLPDLTFGLNVDLSYANFDFSMFWVGMTNFQVFNANNTVIMNGTDPSGKDQNRLKELSENYWRPDRPSTEYTRVYQFDENNNSRLSTWWVEDGDFLRLQNLQIGYTVPQSIIGKIGLSTCRVYVSGSNLLLLTKYTGRDPEMGITSSKGSNDQDSVGTKKKSIMNSGIDVGGYPIPRVFLAGLQVSF